MEVQKINLKIGESKDILLQNRGASGLSLLYECDSHDHDIVSVECIETSPKKLSPGSPNTVLYRLQSKKKGNAHILFYETRSWDEEFQRIPILRIELKVM